MSLRHMRQQGVRSLAITCGAVWCHHCAIMDASFADDVVVPSRTWSAQINNGPKAANALATHPDFSPK